MSGGILSAQFLLLSLQLYLQFFFFLKRRVKKKTHADVKEIIWQDVNKEKQFFCVEKRHQHIKNMETWSKLIFIFQRNQFLPSQSLFILDLCAMIKWFLRRDSSLLESSFMTSHIWLSKEPDEEKEKIQIIAMS